MKRAIPLCFAILMLFTLVSCSTSATSPNATVTDTLTGASVSLGQTQSYINIALRSEGNYDRNTDTYEYDEYGFAIRYEDGRAVRISTYIAEDRYSVSDYSPGTTPDELAALTHWWVFDLGKPDRTLYVCNFDKNHNAVAKDDSETSYDVTISFHEDVFHHLAVELQERS